LTAKVAIQDFSDFGSMDNKSAENGINALGPDSRIQQNSQDVFCINFALVPLG
jgi:hypothetical protein